MNKRKITSYSLDDAINFYCQNADAILMVDSSEDKYHTIKKTGIFTNIIKEDGNYKDLIETLWFHFNNTQDKIIQDYKVFIPTFGRFEGKYSKKLNLYMEEDSQIHVVQMTIYPIGEEQYLFTMDELDNSAYIQEFMTENKVKTIQNIYLFSMYIDLVQNTTSSISITEISDDVVNSIISYSDWRMMIVNMFQDEDKATFLERSEPEYLKANIAPGRTSSFDLPMMNLEGKFIWVKLTFSRAETKNAEDYRYVFMVQDINESSMKLFEELKKYESLASVDPLTTVYNHGRMETEIKNALDYVTKQNMPASCMILDIDHFKNVNDNYGHSVGDNTLKNFAGALLDYLKEKNSTVGRWGGEEFVVVCYDQDLEHAEIKAEKIRNMIGEMDFPSAGNITCSIGVTEIKDNDTLDSAFERMDKALYQAKSEGRNCVRVL